MRHPDDLELAALICSRLCHDLISPVGAIANGFEVLDEERDESMRQMALDIIRSNGRKASARLQFARLAFGAMAAEGDRLSLAEARRLTEAVYEGEKVAVRWADGPAELAKDQAKLLVNLIVIAAQAIPRGGEVFVEVAGQGPRFQLTAQGANARVPAVPSAMFAGNPPEGRVDAHNVQPYYAARIAEAIGFEVGFAAGDETVKISAQPRL